MAYEPTNWKSGDVVTSAKLNKLEQGVANTVVVCDISLADSTSSMTGTELLNAINAGYYVVGRLNGKTPSTDIITMDGGVAFQFISIDFENNTMYVNAVMVSNSVEDYEFAYQLTSNT